MIPHEPFTAGTDYLLAGAGLLAAVGLLVPGRDATPTSRRLWGGGLALFAIATAAGGTYHGFGPDWGPSTMRGLWRVTELSMAASNLLMALGALVGGVTGAGRRLGVLACAGIVVVHLGILLRSDDFVHVVLATLAFQVVMVAGQLGGWRRGRASSAPWVIGGVLITLTAGGVQQAGLALGPLDHNALSHLVQLGAVLAFFLAGQRLEDAREPPHGS